MSTAPSAGPPSRGKFWRHLGVGDAAGSLLAEWAYFTPTQPFGVTKSALRVADERTQIETALVWFGANFKPVAPPGDDRFGFGGSGTSGGFGSAPFYSAPQISVSHSDGSGFSDGSGYAQSAPEGIDAYTVLVAEFGDTLPPPLFDQIASALPGEWAPSWTFVPDMLPATRLTAEETLSAIVLRLDGLIEEVRALTDEYGSIGHNRPADALPFDPEDLNASERAVAEIKATAEGKHKSNEVIAEAQATVQTLTSKLNGYLLKQLDVFITEANKSVAKDLSKLIITAITMAHLRELGALLTHLVQLLANH